jgi:hypothetical protein
MSLKDWERDVINRQRNIVFPDTVLNQARFYRNIASGQAIYRPILKLGVVAQLLYLLFLTQLLWPALSLMLFARIFRKICFPISSPACGFQDRCCSGWSSRAEACFLHRNCASTAAAATASHRLSSC